MPKKKTVVRKPPTLNNKKVVSKAGTTATKPSVVGKVNTKASSNTKSFLNEMRKKKMKEEALLNEDLIYVSGTASTNTR